MKFVVNSVKPKRKVVGFINSTGGLVLKSHTSSDVNGNVVLTKGGHSYVGSMGFDEYLSAQKQYVKEDLIEIYEGDSVTLQF